MSIWKRRRSVFPKVSGKLFKAARITRNVEVVVSGSPAKMLKRLVNILIGRKVVSKIFRR